jgi:hypothetical protein
MSNRHAEIITIAQHAKRVLCGTSRITLRDVP